MTFTFRTTRCATRVRGKLGGMRRCKREQTVITPGDWWHCWQHEQPGQVIHLWAGCHPRNLSLYHYWLSEDGKAMRLCDGDNTEDAPPPGHDADENTELCALCMDIYNHGMDRFWVHLFNEFGDTEVHDD